MSAVSNEFSHLKINDIVYSHIPNAKKLLHFYDNFELVKSYSIKELFDEVQKQKAIFAKYLLKGEAVFISWSLNFEFLVFFLSMLELEVVPAPILPRNEFTSSEYLSYLIELKKNSGISKILAPSELREELVSQGFEIVPHELPKSISQFRNNPQKPYFFNFSEYPNTAYLQFPLHSKGFNNKAVILSHQKLIKNLLQIKETLVFSEGTKALFQGSLSDDFGLLAGVILPLSLGYEQHFINHSDFYKNPKKFIELTSSLKINFWFGTSRMYQTLLGVDFSKEEILDLSHLEVCLCGGEPLGVELFENFKAVYERFHWSEKSFIPFYAPAVNGMMSGVLKEHQNLNYFVKLNQKIASLGKPFPGIHYKIVDDNNYPLGEEQEGFICIKSNVMALGVLNEDNPAEKKLDELSWYNTKDLGFISNGELYLTGRCSDRLFNAGKWISVTDMENKINLLVKGEKKIKTAHVIGINNKNNQDDIYIILEIQFPWKWFFSLYKSKIKKKISEKMNLDKKNILFLKKSELPLAANGTLKRFVLHRDLKSHYLMGLSFIRLSAWL